MNGLIILLITSGFVVIHCKLVIERKEAGDRIYGKYENCSKGGTFYWSKTANHCVYSPKEIGCQLYFQNYDEEIPTVDVTDIGYELDAALPNLYDCAETTIKIQYWSYKGDASYLSQKYNQLIRNSIRVTFQSGDFFPKVIINFKRQLPGILVKFSFGCRNVEGEENEYRPDDCLLVKYKGIAKYPLAKDAFQAISTTITTVATTESTTSAAHPTRVATNITTTFNERTTITPAVTNSNESAVIGNKIANITMPTDTQNATKKLIDGSIAKFGKNSMVVNNNGNAAAENSILGNNNGSTSTNKPVIIKFFSDDSTRVKRIIAVLVVLMLSILVLTILICTCYKKRTDEDKELLLQKEALLQEEASMPKYPENRNKRGEAFNPLYDSVFEISGPAPLFSPHYDNIDKDHELPPQYEDNPKYMDKNGVSRITEDKSDSNKEGKQQSTTLPTIVATSYPEKSSEDNLYDQVREESVVKDEKEAAYATVNKSKAAS